MNDLVEKLTDFEFHRAIQLQNFIDSDVPFDTLQVKCSKKKINGNLCRQNNNLTGEKNC